MAEHPNIATLKRFVDAVFAGDGETVRSLCHPSFTLEEGSGLSFRGTYPGAEGFLHFLEVFSATFAIEKLETQRIYQAGDPDYLIAEMALSATVTETGEPFESSLLELWHFRDGKVAKIKPHYFNAM